MHDGAGCAGSSSSSCCCGSPGGGPRAVGGVAADLGVKAPTFDDGALSALSQAPWTGNIRELRNAVERLVILCGEAVTEADVKRHVAMG